MYTQIKASALAVTLITTTVTKVPPADSAERPHSFLARKQGNNFLPSTWTCGLPLKLSNFTNSIRWHSNLAYTVTRKLLWRFWCHSTTQRQLQTTASNITQKSKPYLFCLEKQDQILKNAALPRAPSQIWHKSLLWLTKAVECQAFQKTHILHITCEIFL